MDHRATRHRVRRAALCAAAATLAAAGVLTYGASSAFAATLLTDTFDDGNADGWARSSGSWAVVTDGSPVYRQSGTSGDARSLAGQTTWTNYSVQARVKPTGYGATNRFVGVIARAQSSSNYYALVVTGSGDVRIVKRAGGAPVTLGTGTAGIATGSWGTLRLDANGSSLRGYVNGTLAVTASDAAFPAGRAGVAAWYASASFDDVAVETLSGAPPTDEPSGGATLPPAGPPLDPGAPPIGFASVNAWG
ncbi:MAG TPA: family 16 glycoside hydrolase [Pilimelia sp.]|nr:family 16 glycoside hydrolase [Pilimelia sp.]